MDPIDPQWPRVLIPLTRRRMITRRRITLTPRPADPIDPQWPPAPVPPIRQGMIPRRHMDPGILRPLATIPSSPWEANLRQVNSDSTPRLPRTMILTAVEGTISGSMY